MVRSTQLIVFSVVFMALVNFSYAQKQECTGGPNDEWTNCGTRCPGTCEKPPPPACSLMCKQGCQCKRGFVRRTEDGQCVTKAECRKKCDVSDGEEGEKCPGKHESWNRCGSLSAPTCDDKYPIELRFDCIGSENGGCRCDDGYVRAVDKSCMLPENCPQ